MINSAGGFVPRLAGVCLETVNALQLPVAVNVYLTNPGQKTSAPPHTDKQDVFVLQTSGYKHWRVYRPPPVSRMPRADPYSRGKGKDILSLSELSEEPLIDTTLGPGQLLYVPAGYPHTTGIAFNFFFCAHVCVCILVSHSQLLTRQFHGPDTIHDIPEDGGPSVHLTIGVDTLIWDLNYASLRRIALQRAGIKDKLLPTKLPDEAYWPLQVRHCVHSSSFIPLHSLRSPVHSLAALRCDAGRAASGISVRASHRSTLRPRHRHATSAFRCNRAGPRHPHAACRAQQVARRRQRRGGGRSATARRCRPSHPAAPPRHDGDLREDVRGRLAEAVAGQDGPQLLQIAGASIVRIASHRVYSVSIS